MAKLIIGDGDPTIFKRFYNEALINQYGDALGYKVVNVSRQFIQDDIECFIRERRIGIRLVRDILNGRNIDFRDSDTIECVDNKEFIMSNNTDYDTTIMTPDSSVYKWIRKDRVILNRLKVENGVPKGINKKGELKTIDPNLFKRLIILNTRIVSLKYYEKLLKNPRFNVIIGVAGKDYDRDRDLKQEQMKSLYQLTDFDYTLYNETRYDNYASIIVPQGARKRYK